MFKYVVNISQAEVQMIDGKVKVPFKGYVPVSLREADHDDVVDCIRRKWIVLREREPTEGELAKLVEGVEDPPKIEFEKPAVAGSSEFPKEKKEVKTKTTTKEAAAEKPAA